MSSLRERWAIIGSFGLVLLLATLGPYTYFRGELDLAAVGEGVGAVSLVLLPLPVVVGMLQRSRGWLAQMGCALVYLSMLVLVDFLELNRMGGMDLPSILSILPLTIPTPMILFFAVLGVVCALQWSRDSLAIEIQRRRLESEEVQRTRRLVERRSRPATIAATLTRIERLLPSQAAAADALVHRLARYARGLLRGTPTPSSSLRLLRLGLDVRGVPTQIHVAGGSDRIPMTEEIAVAIETAAAAIRPASIVVGARGETLTIASADAFLDELQRVFAAGGTRVRRTATEIEIEEEGEGGGSRHPARAETEMPVDPPRPLFGTLLAMVIVCGAFATMNDLRTARAEAYIALARTLAIVIFAIAGILIGLVAIRAARLPLAAGIAVSLTSAFAAGAGVTVLAHFLARQIVGAHEIPRPAMFPYYATMAFTRNIAIAVAVAAIAFAHATSRILLARKLEADRYRDDVALAEARELEARFQPHFLFNALTSIAALIRSDPERAAQMCRRLSDLFERIVASTGIPRWPLAAELELAADYLAVQRMRFGDRIRIDAWDVPASNGDVQVPRLVLQPLLENAVKHAVSRRDGGTSLGLKIERRRRMWRFHVWNDAAATSECVRFGRGLAFVRKSVESAGGELRVEGATNGRFAVTCSIPM